MANSIESFHLGDLGGGTFIGVGCLMGVEQTNSCDKIMGDDGGDITGKNSIGDAGGVNGDGRCVKNGLPLTSKLTIGIVKSANLL